MTTDTPPCPKCGSPTEYIPAQLGDGDPDAVPPPRWEKAKWACQNEACLFTEVVHNDE